MTMESTGAANPFPGGSPGGSPTGAGGVTEGSDVVQRMVMAVEAAVAAAQAATRAVEMAQSSSHAGGEENRSWWKLLPKPPVYDHSSRESEIAGWREWSWTFEQYMASVDTRFSDDIQEMRKDPSKTIDPVDFVMQSDNATAFCIACCLPFSDSVP